MSKEKEQPEPEVEPEVEPEPEPEAADFVGVDEQYQNYSSIHRAPL